MSTRSPSAIKATLQAYSALSISTTSSRPTYTQSTSSSESVYQISRVTTTNMGKRKSKSKRPATTSEEKSSQDITTIHTITDLRANQDLWFKTRLLIFDLYNMSNDKFCEARTLQTTDPLYISSPYFLDAEAAVVKNVIVDPTTQTTLEQAISSSLENFFEKRRASADWRPCGPHDMVPVYLACLGMEKREMEEEGFVARARRWRVGKS